MASVVENLQGNEARPFLKWAGGKRWLVERHPDEFPIFSGTYFEPFLGGGSVFFHLSPKKAHLSDANARLVECYCQIRDNHESVRTLLVDHQEQHCETYYYRVRGQKFASGDARAAQFLYLNRTCFNGLYRVNRNGDFNVPIGTKTKVIDDSENFEAIASILRVAKIEAVDFEQSIDKAEYGDFVFVDPPYTVKHNSNGFLKYNENIFSWCDQVRLRDAIVRAEKRGAKLLLTNAAHESVVDLYRGVGRQNFVKRSSVLAGKSSARGRVDELVVTIG